MPTLRMMRLLNSLETGSTTGTQLQTLLADTGRLGEFTNLLNLRSQTKRLASSPTAMAAVAASSTAMTAIGASSTAMSTVAASTTAMTAVAASSTARDVFFGSNYVGKGLDTLAVKDGLSTNATLAGLATISLVTANSTACNAVAASSTAMTAVAASSNAMRSITTSSLSFWLGRLFPSCGGYLAGYIDTNASTRYYYFAAPRANGGQTTTGIPWYATSTNQSGLVDIASYNWPGLTSTGIIDASAASGTGFNGQANTAALYAAGDTSAGTAGGFAKTRSVTLGSSTFTDYFLGSVYEMDMCYRNATSFNANVGSSEQWDMTQYYWTSTENNGNASWTVLFASVTVGNVGKGNLFFVRGLRKFTI